MALYNIEAICIRSVNTGEADKIVTLFSKVHGKIRAIAKGARRPASKFGGRLEVFSYDHIQLATARHLDIMSQCETIESFYRLREDRKKLNCGFYIVKLIDIITEDRQRNDELFDLLLGALYALQSSSDPGILSRAFEVKLSKVEGFLPSDQMLENKFRRLPLIVDKLSGDMKDLPTDLSENDLKISGRIFRNIISDHTGKDIRKARDFI